MGLAVVAETEKSVNLCFLSIISLRIHEVGRIFNGIYVDEPAENSCVDVTGDMCFLNSRTGLNLISQRRYFIVLSIHYLTNRLNDTSWTPYRNSCCLLNGTLFLMLASIIRVCNLLRGWLLSVLLPH